MSKKLREKLIKLKEGEVRPTFSCYGCVFSEPPCMATQVVDGLVDGVETFGIFVDFWSHKEEYRGLCHISAVTGSKIGACYSSLLAHDAANVMLPNDPHDYPCLLRQSFPIFSPSPCRVP
jgi:hypothetical protein